MAFSTGTINEVVQNVHSAQNFGPSYQSNFVDSVDTSRLKLKKKGTTEWTNVKSGDDIDKGPELVRLNNPDRKINVKAQAGEGILKAHVALSKTVPKGLKSNKIDVDGPPDSDFPGFTIDATLPNQTIPLQRLAPGLYHEWNRYTQQDSYHLMDIACRGSFEIQVSLHGKAIVSPGPAAYDGIYLQEEGDFEVIEGTCEYRMHYN